MSQCTEAFDRIAHELGGFTCQNAPAIVRFRNPFELTNWTLPVLEWMMVAGAALALWWSIRRLRRDADPTNLVLWLATSVYLLVVEIPMYFPNIFGVEDYLGGQVFDHNVFTVQFMYERLPLYIVALYPALTTLAYEIVRMLGVFRRRGVLVGAVCVGVVHHFFYEVFDQLGPQLRWWAWNTELPLNQPFLSSVPWTSVVLFAAGGPFVITLLVLLLVGRPAERGAHLSSWNLVWRTAVSGALVPLGMAVLSLPATLFGGDHPNLTARAVIFGLEIAVFVVVGVPVMVQQWLAARRDEAGEGQPNTFIQIFGPLYLVVLLVLWLSALPDYFGAVDGVTSDSTPRGNLLYAAFCFAGATLSLAAALTATRERASNATRIGVSLA